MRAKRNGLNPKKIGLIYCLAFILVAFHQSGRLAEWCEDLGGGRGLMAEAGSEAAAFIKTRLEPYGPAFLHQREDQILSLWPRIEVGARPEAPRRDFSSLAAAIPVKLDSVPIQTPAARPDPSETAAQEPEAAPVPEGVADGLVMGRTESAASVETAVADVEIFNPRKVLLLGDSMMLEGLGPPLQRKLKAFEGLQVSRDGRYGTGLCRLDVFDWLNYFDEILDKYQPDLVIITLGANDSQDIVDVPGIKRLNVATEEWNEVYRARVTDLLKRAEARGVRVFWVGLPVMGREPYGQRVANINLQVAAACAESPNGLFWDGWLSVADEKGEYTVYASNEEGKKVRIRAKDQIHLTESGGEMMAVKFLAETAGWASYEQPAAESGEGLEMAGTSEPADPETPPAAGEKPAAEPPPLLTPGPARLEERTLISAVRGRATQYLVARPSLTAEQILTPRAGVILLHGAWDGPPAWADHASDVLADLADQHNLFIIMPDGEPFGWYLDGLETPIESYLLEEFIPELLRTLPIDPDRLGITGLSMGGHGALTLALKHPGRFKAASSMSGVLDLTAHGDGSSLNRSLKLVEALGPFKENLAAWQASSAYWLTKNNPSALAGTALLVTVGKADHLTLAENRRYWQLLKELGIKHQYREESGGHDWIYWRAQLPGHLNFLAEHLQ